MDSSRLSCASQLGDARMAAMPPRWRRTGPVGERVAENIRRLRRQAEMTTYQLAGRLTELGVPMDQSSVTRVERVQRGVSVDELVAFAVALGVSPNALLLPEPFAAADGQYGVTPTTTAEAASMWEWATGEQQLALHGVEGEPVPAPLRKVDLARFRAENGPHRFPGLIQLVERRDHGES